MTIPEDDLFATAAREAARFRASLATRKVSPAKPETGFAGPLNENPLPPMQVLDELIVAAEGGLVASAGPRYFGFVVGGALPAATAADMMTAAWDQNTFSAANSPAAVAAEDAAGTWLKELLGIPATATVGFVTGAQGANTVGLAAARHHMLARLGWDVERQGLYGAPRVRVIANEERHATIDRSLRLLGFGTEMLEPVAAGPNGVIDLAALEKKVDGPAIVCLQAGNVNTGAFDDLRGACEIVHARGGWAHVDGAFGLWAAASPTTRRFVDGIELADSWGCDGHKWLNVPYDNGFAFCAHPMSHAAAIAYTAAYLIPGQQAEAGDLTLESSRRARGFTVWAALRQLGRTGVAELVERCCRLARRFADQLSVAGFEVGNEVVLNQVLVRHRDDASTDRMIEAVQRDGTCWMGGTTWRGKRYMRISVSNADTTDSDVDLSVEAIKRAASESGA